MKKIFFVLMCSLLILSTGCSNDKVKEKTLAYQLEDLFISEIAKTSDIEELADSIVSSDIIPLSVSKRTINNGDFLTGFDSLVSKYKDAVVVEPMIGSQPFILYIFNTDTPKELEQELKDNYNLRWNICTEADEMVLNVEGNIIFFVMSPKSFDE